MTGALVDTADFDTACEAVIAVERAVGIAMVDTINSICTNNEQKNMAQIMATAALILKLEMSKTELGSDFGQSVDIALAQLRALPLDPDGTRDISQLAERVAVN
jgi:hypothetical protein